MFKELWHYISLVAIPLSLVATYREGADPIHVLLIGVVAGLAALFNKLPE